VPSGSQDRVGVGRKTGIHCAIPNSCLQTPVYWKCSTTNMPQCLKIRKIYSKFSYVPNYVYIVKFIDLFYNTVMAKFQNPSSTKAGTRILSAAGRSQMAVIASGNHSAATVWHMLSRCCVLRLISEQTGVWIFC